MVSNQFRSWSRCGITHRVDGYTVMCSMALEAPGKEPFDIVNNDVKFKE